MLRPSTQNRTISLMEIAMSRNMLKYITVICVLFSTITVTLSGVFFLIDGFKPKIFFPNGITHDWGVVNEGELVKHSFVFENRGKKLLE